MAYEMEDFIILLIVVWVIIGFAGIGMLILLRIRMYG